MTRPVETEALVKAIVTNAANLPIAALELREDLMPPERQHQLASLLIELGQLLHQHADAQMAIAPTGQSACRPPTDRANVKTAPP